MVDISSADFSSPCIKVCVLDPVHRICTGCGRTMQEISHWMCSTDAERQHIRKQLGARIKKLKEKR